MLEKCDKKDLDENKDKIEEFISIKDKLLKAVDE